MQIVETVVELRAVRQAVQGLAGLVPTMGALHAGHIALVEQARRDNESVIVSIFVNPAQFGPNEDLSAYPRNLPRDLELLQAAGADVVFTPSPELIYPPAFQTYIEVGDIATGLEGDHRPGHFRGVATVVAKLFNLTQPHTAYFGQKDAQQVAVIRRMAADMNFPVTIHVHPTVREADGLAMSSRNAYLTAEQRAAAPALYRALSAAAERYAQGERDPHTLREIMRTVLEEAPLTQVEYISVADAQTLRELATPHSRPLLLSLAARVGRARLIDNLLLPIDLNKTPSQTLGLP